MTTSDSAPSLYLERVATRQYVAHNPRGAEVLIGDGPGRFSPGELLKIALAGCNALSADFRLQRVLGEDFAQAIAVSGDYNEDDDSFDSFQVELIQDLSPLNDEDREAVVRRADKAIDRHCTIGHTLEKSTPCERSFTSEIVKDDSTIV